MTREDIIKLAREAGLPIFDAAAVANDPAQQSMADIVTKVWHDSAERFAKLVAAAEREACAKLCEELRDDWLRGLGRYEFMGEGADYCADAIRERVDQC